MVSYYLFGKPSFYIEEGSDISSTDMDNLKNEVSPRLRAAKPIVESMQERGFIPHMMIYEIGFDHKKIDNEIDARDIIYKAGLNPDDFEYNFEVFEEKVNA